MATRSRLRPLLMALGMLALLTGVWSGLVRLGSSLPDLHPSFVWAHGPLMVCGFLGTLIGLERAVGTGWRWAYVAPIATGLGALTMLAGLSPPLSATLFALGSLGLVAVYAMMLRRQPALFMITMALGALFWLAGNLLWLSGLPIYRVALWWAGFLILTIAGERLELSRLLRLSGRERFGFAVAAGLWIAGVIGGHVHPDLGIRAAGAGLVSLALWLLTHDVARRTARQSGLSRFVAVSLLSGYVWLGASGLLGLVTGDLVAGPRYDALLHGVFLGFVFAMIFGHAPLIFPGVLGLPLSYQPSFYGHLVLLHGSLVLRFIADLLDWLPGRSWGSLLNAGAILLFLLNTARAISSARRGV